MSKLQELSILQRGGVIAILRTENKKLENGEILYSEDESREWEIIEEPHMRISPLSAHKKENGEKNKELEITSSNQLKEMANQKKKKF